MQKKQKKVVLGVSAGISIYKSCDILRRLQDEGFSVTVIMTRESRELIRPIVFESLSGEKAYCELFDSPGDWDIKHISLAKKADLLLIAPATANIIAKIASGICDDLLTCTVLATTSPVLIAPAMNENMYNNKITQANIARLKGLGFVFVGPEKGRLACGDIGNGCLAKTEEIVKAVKKNI